MSQGSENWQLAEIAAEIERQRQNIEFCEDRGIHHFNYLGNGVRCKSATPPAISLLVAVAGAKASFILDGLEPLNLHGYAVMRSAMKLVDPVIYHGPIEDLSLRGERLREAATGFCEKFYTRHGTWEGDDYEEDEDRPAVDWMDLSAYLPQSLPITGWFHSPPAMDRGGFHTRCQQLANSHKRRPKLILRRLRSRIRGRSPLRNVTTVAELNVQLSGRT